MSAHGSAVSGFRSRWSRPFSERPRALTDDRWAEKNGGRPLTAGSPKISIPASCYLFPESLDFSSSLRAFQMVLGFSAGMYTSTDLLDFHYFSGCIFLFFHYVCICCIFLNFVAVILESYYKDIGAHAKGNNKVAKMSVKKMRKLFVTLQNELNEWICETK